MPSVGAIQMAVTALALGRAGDRAQGAAEDAAGWGGLMFGDEEAQAGLLDVGENGGCGVALPDVPLVVVALQQGADAREVGVERAADDRRWSGHGAF